MAITAMDTIKKINKNFLNSCIAVLLPSVIVQTTALAGDWQIIPNLSLDETYTDNVQLTPENNNSSFVTQTIYGLDTEYNSSLTTLQWSGRQILARYSHDSELNNSFRTLNANGEHSFWRGGPTVLASASIENISQNSANNSSADLVSGDTVEQRNYSTGLRYNFGNSSYSVASSVNYSITRADDNIGDNNGFTAMLGSENGNNARTVYWQLDSNYTKRKQSSSNNDGENFTVEALIGAITPWNLNPFLRYYDENIQGTGVTQSLNTTSSWGPGIRWLASPHIILDLSYNFVADKAVSDNYFNTSLQWEPSTRTSLTLGYSQRFFGDSYNLNFSHRTRRLTNSISYNEDIEVFDRNSFQSNTPDDTQLVESDEFSLNKSLTWSSQLQLSRTVFGMSLSTNERTSLATNIVDDILDANINFIRTISPRSTLSLSASFNSSIYDKENPGGNRQEDYYRTISASYTKNLLSELSYNLILRHINRDSTINNLSYQEMRATINITKEF